MIYFPFKSCTNLGNWMWQYAAALSSGHRVIGWLQDKTAEKKLKPYGDIFGDLKIVEELPPGVEMYNYPSNKPIAPLDLQHDKAYCILDYYGDEKFYDEELIRRKFGITESRENYLRVKYGKWLDAPNVTGISVRRGDYMWKAHWFPFVGEKYFQRAIAAVPECDDFVVCSDDISWCKGFFTSSRFKGKRFLFVEGEAVLNQLYIHTLCKNNILSNSSFSWWGGWLNPYPKKRVFIPLRWYGFAFPWGKEAKSLHFKGVEVIENHYTIRRWLWGQITWNYLRLKRKIGPVYRFIRGR